jgi:hypothetical protein
MVGTTSSFSYSKLTLLQVQGAQERSRQSIEMAQNLGRLSSAVSRWKVQIGRSKEEDQAQGALFEQSIQSTFSDREISVIMAGRLVRLCRAEYRANVVFPRALARIEAECQDEINLWKDRSKHEEEESLRAVQRLQEKIRGVRQEMERIQLEQVIHLLRQRLTFHRRDSAAEPLEFTTAPNEREAHCLSPVYVVEEPLDSSDPVSTSNPHQTKDSVEWIEIDDEYFHACVDDKSDWVFCL